MVVVDVIGEYLFQMPASQNDHVIQAFSADGSYDALRAWTLPGRAGHRGHFLNAKCSDLATKSRAVDRIVVAQQKPRSGVSAACLEQLPCSPLCTRVCHDIEVQDSPAIVAQDDENKQDAKRRRRHSEKIKRKNVTGVIFQKCLPCVVAGVIPRLFAAV